MKAFITKWITSSVILFFVFLIMAYLIGTPVLILVITHKLTFILGRFLAYVIGFFLLLIYGSLIIVVAEESGL